MASSVSEKRVVVTQPFVGLLYMQVCAVDEASDEEILNICNNDNPAGTNLGWCHVIREDGEENQRPGKCSDDTTRTHFLISC